MDNIIELLIFVAIIYSVIGGLSKKKKPPQQRPGQRGAPPDRQGRPGAGGGREYRTPSGAREAGGAGARGPRASQRQAGEVSAADMVPDELWRILTGERRSPAGAGTQERRERAAEPEAETPPWLESEPVESEAEAWAEPAEAEPSRPSWLDDEAASPEEEPEVVQPVVVSRELPPLGPEARHAAFHRKLERTAPAVPGATTRRGAKLRMRGRSDLRRAVVLSEVLGPPKALRGEGDSELLGGGG